MKRCLIKQPAGLGDIFFTLKIAKRIINELNIEVDWPVISNYYYIKNYINYNKLNFYDINDIPKEYLNIYNTNEPKISNDLIFLPLQNASTYLKTDEIMFAKYKLVNLDYNDWSTFFTFKRNEERENKLYTYLNPNNEEYILINNKFASPPNIETIDIKLNTDKKIIYMNSTGFDNVFDWCKLLENAKEIHTVNTSFCYIVEKLNVCDKLYMYQRGHYFNDFNYIKNIYKKEWIYENRSF